VVKPLRVEGISEASTESPDEEPSGASEPPPVGPPRARPVVLVLALILTSSVVVVFVGVFAFGLSALQEQRSQRQLYATFRGLLDPASEVPPPIGGSIPDGTPIALLTAPDAGIHDAAVVEGTSATDLLQGPGHLRDSPLPGQAGDAVLLGRSTIAGGPFRNLDRLRAGDQIVVRTGQGRFRFVVEDLRIGAGRAPLIPGGGALMTLVTSSGNGWLGVLSPTHLLYVDTKLEQRPVAAPRGRPATVPSTELPGHGDPGAWPWVALWLAAFVVACALSWWLWFRLGILRTWLIAIPVLFAILWGLSTEIVRLLPNVY